MPVRRRKVVRPNTKMTKATMIMMSRFTISMIVIENPALSLHVMREGSRLPPFEA
jgi:hypothetical protein